MAHPWGQDKNLMSYIIKVFGIAVLQIAWLFSSYMIQLFYNDTLTL